MPYSAAAIFIGHLQGPGENVGFLCCRLLIEIVFFFFHFSFGFLQGRCLMLTEELGQVHQAIAPVSVWFRYLITYQEVDGTPGLTLGILLALLYLIMKVGLVKTISEGCLHECFLTFLPLF